MPEATRPFSIYNIYRNQREFCLGKISGVESGLSFRHTFKQVLSSNTAQVLPVCCPWPQFFSPYMALSFVPIKSLWDQTVSQIRKNWWALIQASPWCGSTWSHKCLCQWQGTVPKVTNWRHLERWNWFFQQWALSYADLHVCKSSVQTVRIPPLTV